MAEEVLKLEDELRVLRAEYNKLQEHLSDIEFKYQSELITSRDQEYNQEEQFASNLQKAVTDFFNNPLYSDIVILMEDGREISGHKLIISARTDDWGGTGLDLVDSLDLKDIRYDVAYAMIKWVYTDEINIQEDSLLIELLLVSTRLKLDSLHIRCQKVMISFIDNNNCNTFLKISEKLSCQLLKDYCEDYLSQCKNILNIKVEKQSRNDDDDDDDDIPVSFWSENQIHDDPESQTSTNIERTSVSIYGNDWNKLKPRGFTCDVCWKVCSSLVGLNQHFKTHTGGQPFKCDLCNKIFQVRSRLKEHIKNHMKTFKGGACGKAYGDQNSGITDDTTDIADNSDSCSTRYGEELHSRGICEELLRQKPDLQKHLVIHSGTGSVKREAIFSNTSSLKIHQKIIQEFINSDSKLESYDFQCDVCLKYLSCKSQLEIHKRSHNGEKPFSCDYCSKSFAQKSTLSDHIRIHTGEKPHKCDVCGKAFIQKSTLNDHVKSHTSQNVKCNVCLKSFWNASNLRRHMTIHSGVKAFKCTICEKSFREKRYLQLHLRLHSGEKPYSCSLCQKAFVDSSYLSTHKKTVHPVQ